MLVISVYTGFCKWPVCTAITSWGWYDAYGIGSLNPLFDSKNKSIGTWLCSNVTEFRNIKIGIVQTLEDAEVVKRISCGEPIIQVYSNKSLAWCRRQRSGQRLTVRRRRPAVWKVPSEEMRWSDGWRSTQDVTENLHESSVVDSLKPAKRA